MTPMMGTILLVEDEEGDVFFMRQALKKAGVLNPLQVACDGQEAIDYFKGTGKFANREEFPLPCLTLLDLKLPRVMGLNVLQWIREQSEVAAIILILTSSREEVDIVTAYHLGANGYLVKPSDVSQLTDIAKSIKDFWLTQNTPPTRSSKPTGSPHSSTTSPLQESPKAAFR
jgi:DNA-binding response OmpR family regulator